MLIRSGFVVLLLGFLLPLKASAKNFDLARELSKKIEAVLTGELAGVTILQCQDCDYFYASADVVQAIERLLQAALADPQLKKLQTHTELGEFLTYKMADALQRPNGRVISFEEAKWRFCGTASEDMNLFSYNTFKEFCL